MKEVALYDATDVSDQELWQKMQHGNHDAFTQLLTRHTRSLLAYGLQFSNDKDAIKDCIQDLFVGIWTTRNRLGSVKSVRTYLLVSLRRKVHVINVRRTRLPLFGGLPEESPFMINYSMQEEWIDSDEELEKIQSLNTLINSLPDRQKEVLYLKFYQERSTEEIAEIMNIRYQSVSNLVQRALENLRTRWKYELDVLALLCLLRIPA